MWKIKVAIQNEQFKQVEAWLVHENVIAALGMDKVLECTLLCEKERIALRKQKSRSYNN